MFRRLKSSLPQDPVYPKDFKGLGYFINENDEIRNIENSDNYFKFFLTKSDRNNGAQREAMNECVRELIASRLSKLDIHQIRVPLGASATDPHTPINVSSNLSTASRTIIIFYENNQDLGVFAHRIIGGPGGINLGSAVNLASHLTTLPDVPGLILANIGQLRWWRRGKKACTQVSWYALPQHSAVDPPYRFDEHDNTIPGNRTTMEHCTYIFNEVVPALVNPEAKLQVIGVSEGAICVSKFLDDEKNFERWGESGRLEAFAAVNTYYDVNEIENERFALWLRAKGRSYQISEEPEGTFIAGADGTRVIPAYGCPTFSLGEPYYTENLLPKGYKTIISWFQEVARDSNYANPIFVRFDDDGDDEVEETWAGYEDNPLGSTAVEAPDSTASALPAERVFELGGENGSE